MTNDIYKLYSTEYDNHSCKCFYNTKRFFKSLFGYIRAKCKSCWRKIKGEKEYYYT